jgi:hypothetical protein
MFEPEKLEAHLLAIEQNPDIRFFHTNYFLFDEQRHLKCELKLDPRECVPPVDLQVLKLFETNYINGISIAIHRDVFDVVGRFDEKYRYGQDFDMWLRINALYRAFYIDHKTCVTRWHKDQGMRSFPPAGSYDSARACVEFLNSHKFSECFPAIDMTTARGIAKAVKETMAVVFNKNAMMYRCFFNSVMLERLADWLCKDCPDNLMQELITPLAGTIGNLSDSQLPIEIKEALSEFLQNIKVDFSYQVHDFLQEAAQNAKKLSDKGESRKADSIGRYLSLTGPRLNEKTCDNGKSDLLLSDISPESSTVFNLR